jgi:hypothetical protein
MRTELRKPFSNGFVLTEQELRRIYALMVQRIKQIVNDDDIVDVFELKFKNGIVVKKASLDEIISENNSDKWEIQELKMGVLSKSRPSEVQIGISFKKINSPSKKDEMHSSIYYFILGDDRDWVYITSSELDERIAKIKQYLMVFYGLLAIILGTFILIMSLIIFFPPGSSGPSLSDEIIALFVSGLIISGGIAVIYGFPSFNFCWGDYIGIFNKRQTVGKFIIFTVIIGIVLGIISGIIANRLSH